MKIFYCDHFVLPLPEKHRFPMQKYSLLRERVVAGRLVPPNHLLEPESATDEQLAPMRRGCPASAICGPING